MKKYIMMAITCCMSALTLAGCGGGGGGSTSPSGVVTTVYLYGNMSTNGTYNNYSTVYRISTVDTSFTVPSGVMVNYSSAPNATSGLCATRALATPGQCILRDGVIVPSGPVSLAVSDFNGSTYNIASRVFSLSAVNTSRLNLRSSTTANSGMGEEIARINFRLEVPGVVPTLPLFPGDPLLTIVSQERELLTHPTSTVDQNVVLTGSQVNFFTP